MVGLHQAHHRVWLGELQYLQATCAWQHQLGNLEEAFVSIPRGRFFYRFTCNPNVYQVVHELCLNILNVRLGPIEIIQTN